MMRMKKGLFFSFIMVFLTVTIISLIAIQTSLISHRREELFIENRINSMNNLYESIVRDVQKSLEIIAIRAMAVTFTNVSSPPGNPLDEANETLKELILNGTLENTPMPLMENATFLEWIDKIQEVSELKGFNTIINVHTMTIRPYDSFNLEIQSYVSINISDEQGVASLNKFTNIDTLVFIEDLPDPLYPLNTEGLGSSIVKKSPHVGNYTQLLLIGNGDNSFVYGETTYSTTSFDDKILVANSLGGVSGINNAKGIIFQVGDSNTTPIIVPYIINSSALSLISENINVLLDGDAGKVWYIDNLIIHAENSYYQSSSDGPSYLDRLEGELQVQNKYSSQTNNLIGLESFIDKDKLYLWGVPTGDIFIERTNIDYIYFSGGTTVNCIKGVDSSFRIDDEHLSAYNVTDLTTSCS